MRERVRVVKLMHLIISWAETFTLQMDLSTEEKSNDAE